MILKIQAFIKSIWLFPAIITLVFALLVITEISGSSIGLYHKIFYGDKTDTSLIANQPQSIRSDEWLLGSAKTFGQYNNGFKDTNPNIGNGEVQGFLSDAPAIGPTTPFKPHNFGFFFLSFDKAFAFKWWMLSYLLILSVYFFVLLMLPRRKLLAAGISLAFLFSPFIQWWYLYGTLGTIAYSLLGISAVIMVLRSKSKLTILLWSIIVLYIAVCFALVLYPPFQIPCALVSLVFLGFYLQQNKQDFHNIKIKIASLVLSVLLAVVSVLIIFAHYSTAVTALSESSYPGDREVYSGFYSMSHLFSGSTSYLLQYPEKSTHYQKPEINAVNNSESSNFIYISVFLLPLLVILLANQYRKRRTINYEIAGVLLLYTIIFAWLFIPHITLLGKPLLLDKVPHPRLLIGLGLLNLITLVVFIRYYSKQKWTLSIQNSIIYGLLIFIAYLCLHMRINYQMPGFMSLKESVLLALVIPLIVFLLVRKHFHTSVILLLTFTFFSTWKINPLYHGTAILTQNPITEAIKELSINNDKRWVSDDINIENFAAMSGSPSLSGTYIYPQVGLWSQFSPSTDESVYNRYAHVNFNFDRDATKDIDTRLSLVGTDQFAVTSEPCSKELEEAGVAFLITTLPFEKDSAKCASLRKTVNLPVKNYYLYELKF